MNEIIKQKLADRQHTARKIANDNLQKVFSVPKLAELYKQKQKLTIQKAKASAYGEPFDISQLNSITNELETELKKINLSIEDLSPKYFCPICQDTGLVEGKVCDCVKKLQSELNLKQTQFNNLKTFKDSNFSIFENPQIKNLYDILQKFSQSDNSKYIFITLSGSTGVGKTFLLECVASEFIERNKDVLLTSSFMLNNDFLKFHTAKDKNSALLDKYLSPEILIIDDLGSEPFFRNVTQNYLFLILDQRTREKKRTLISTNFSPEQLREVYGERCFSRIINKSQNLFLKMENPDLRLKIKNN